MVIRHCWPGREAEIRWEAMQQVGQAALYVTTAKNLDILTHTAPSYTENGNSQSKENQGRTEVNEIMPIRMEDAS